MTNFVFYFKQGLSHISDLGAYDHILFIVAMTALYNYKQWKALLILVTAFTFGHSLALGLATFEIVKISKNLVEFLIPVTIIFTCLGNFWSLKRRKADTKEAVFYHVKTKKPHYLIILFFGLIHGLGFSNYLRFITNGTGEGIFTPLLAFNLGLEFGQIFILLIVLVINFVFLGQLKIKAKYWTAILSFIVILMSLQLMIETGKVLFIN